TKSLSTKLGFPPKWLLSNEGVRTCRSGVYLIIHQVSKFQHIHIAYSHFILESLSSTPIIQYCLTCTWISSLFQCVHYILLICTVEYRRSHMPTKSFCRKA